MPAGAPFSDAAYRDLHAQALRFGLAIRSWFGVRAAFRRLPMYDELRTMPLWDDAAPARSLHRALLILAHQRRR